MTIKGSWVVCCNVCETISDAVSDMSWLTEELEKHHKHIREVEIAGTVQEHLSAMEFIRYVPDDFKEKFWENKLDKFFAEYGDHL